MAIIKFGTIVTEIRGKLGGHNFSWNRGGNVLQTNSNNNKPTMASVGRTQAIKNINANVKNSWRALTDIQRSAWHAAATNVTRVNKVSEVITLNGYEYFCKVQQSLLNCALPVLTTPPILGPVTLLGGVKFHTLDLTHVSIGTTNSYNADEYLMVSMSRGLSAGLTPSKKDFAQILQMPSTTPQPFNTIAYYQNFFGDPIVGSTIWLKAYLINGLSGQHSPLYFDKKVVA